MKFKTPSPTTLILGLEAMHITSNRLVKSLADELEEATKNKMDNDKSDTESVASCESKEYDASAESDGATSFDEGNESMEYISPSKVIGKEKQQDPATPAKGRDGMKTRDRRSAPELDKPLSSLPGIKLPPAERSIKPLRTKSPQSSSPIENTPTSAQAMTKDLPFTTSDFTFGSTVASPKSPRLSSPAQSMAAALHSATFEFSFGSAASSPKSSTPSSPVQATPTPTLSTAANKFDFSFDATATKTQLNLDVTAEANIAASAQLSTPQDTNDDEKKPEIVAAIATSPLNLNAPGVDNVMESPQMSTPQPTNDEKKSEATQIFNLSTLRPSSISPPSIIPNLPPTSFNFNELSKALPNGVEKKNTTPSTLATLTKTTQALQTSIESIRSALYGVNPSSEISQPAKNAGLLLMNDCVAGWINGSRLHYANVDIRFITFGNQMELMHQDLTDLKFTTAKTIEQLGSEHTAALSEIKELMGKQMKEVQELHEREQASLAAALRRNNDLVEELAKVKEAQKASDKESIVLRAENRAFKETMAKAQETRQQEQTSFATLATQNQNLAHEILEAKVARIVSEEENKSLRAENREIKKMMEEENHQCQKLIQRLTAKVEFAVTSLVGLQFENEGENEDEGESDEMSDNLMQVLWPQGWEEEGVKKRCAIDGEVLQRGVLANGPGFRVPAQNVGRGGGGWCIVM